MLLVTTWMDMENIMLSHINQSLKDKYCMNPPGLVEADNRMVKTQVIFHRIVTLLRHAKTDTYPVKCIIFYFDTCNLYDMHVER
jgi:hypothetical protein